MKVALRLHDDPSRNPPITEYVAANPDWHADRFQAKDDDELNEYLKSGRYAIVLYPDLDTLLEALWKGHAEWPAWLAAGVRIEIGRPPAGDWRALMPQIHSSFVEWRRRRDRRQILAAAIISAITLASIVVLFALLGAAN